MNQWFFGEIHLHAQLANTSQFAPTNPHTWTHHGERERNVTECVVFIIHIMVVFYPLTFKESNLQRKKYHFVNT
jgi:hypothetical protein